VIDELTSLENVSQYRMHKYSNYAVLDDALMNDIFSETDSAEYVIDYALLSYRTKYEIKAVHADGNLAYTFAIIYLIDGSWYYLDLRTLTEEQLDGDGMPTYRDGQVNVGKLSEATGARIFEAEGNLNAGYTDLSYETAFESDLLLGRALDEYGFTIGATVIVISAILLFSIGFILPLPVYALGLILPRIKRLGKPKYWYSLCALAGMWTLLSVLMFIVVTLAVLI
jgi:hypothetical protein